MKPAKAIRAVSAVGVTASILYMLVAFTSLIMENPSLHARLMLYGALILFPYAVSLAYVASVTKRHIPDLAPITLATILLIPVPMLAMLGVDDSYLTVIVAISGLLGVPSAIIVGKGRKSSVKLSLYLVALTYLTMSIASIALTISPTSIFLYHALVLVLAFPVPLIYAVTVNSFPATFKDQPNEPLSYPLPWLSLISGLLILDGYQEVASYLVVLTLALYIYSARIYKWIEYRERLRKYPEGPAKKGLEYFLWGHVAVIIAILIMTAYILGLPGECTGLCYLHLFTLGFITLHVWIHGPLMLPVILGVRHRRRFTLAPYILLVAAMAVFPAFMSVAFILYVASFIAAVYIVL